MNSNFQPPTSNIHNNSIGLISCTQLTKRFRNLTAVDSLDLTVEKGEVFGFLGPNGAGKSTTLRMMVGLIRPTSGVVSVFGRDVWHDHVRAMSSVGALIEAPAFYKYLSGRDNLRILANSGGRYSEKDIDEALDTVGLLNRAKDKVKGYSQGMRQRLGIGLALVGKPKLVLLDEPTNGLDPEGMKEIRELIARLREDKSMAIFLSSHLLHEVEQVCTRVGVVNKGRLIVSGTVDELRSEKSTYNLLAMPVDVAARVAQESGWQVTKNGEDGALAVSSTDGSSADLNRRLVEAGVAVSEIVPEKTSLEDMYLKIMADDNA